MRASAHPRQPERIRALKSFDVLDTPRERDFDEIVELASKLCGTSISVVNMIDVDRQWFKAEVGLGLRETPLETSICSHIILEEDFVEIPDTLKDPRLRDNPLCVAEPGLRFYAGALLKTEDGLPLGTLCVLDAEPRELTELQRESLRVLARQVMAQLDLRRQLRLAADLRTEIDHRVKNSLASIGAHIRLNARRLPEGYSAADALKEVGHQINAVSLVHEQLCRSDSGESLDLVGYLAKLVGYLARAAPARIEVVSVFATEVLAVSPASATSAGLFVNEGVSNAIKHAFAEGERGRIAVSLSKRDGGYTLSVSDDGTGIGSAGSDGLGMKVLHAAARSLGGGLRVASSSEGTTVAVGLDPVGGL